MQPESGMVAVAHIEPQLIAFLPTVLTFRVVAAVPELADWQAAAAGATWLLLGGHGSSLAGVVLLYLGTISYGMYVWQGILAGNGPYRQVPGWPPEPLLGAMLAVALAALSYRFFEEPILRYKDRLGRLARPEV